MNNTEQERLRKDGIELLPGEEPIYDRMKQCYKKADVSGAAHAKDAVRCGAALIEQREFLARYDLWDLSQGTRVNPVTMEPRAGGVRKLFHGGDTDPNATLISRMRAAEIPKPRGQRWMVAAENIIRSAFDLKYLDPIPLQLEHQGKRVFLSEALALDDDKSDTPALDFQRQVFARLKKRSLNDAIAGRLDDEAAEDCPVRAVNGVTLGGRGHCGDNRKDYAQFTFLKLSHMDTFLGHWDTMGSKQQSEIMDVLEAVILGREYVFNRYGQDWSPRRFSPWPVEICERAAKAIKMRLKNL